MGLLDRIIKAAGGKRADESPWVTLPPHAHFCFDCLREWNCPAEDKHLKEHLVDGAPPWEYRCAACAHWLSTDWLEEAEPVSYRTPAPPRQVTSEERVTSERTGEVYEVKIWSDRTATCTCSGWRSSKRAYPGQPNCKHIDAVLRPGSVAT